MAKKKSDPYRVERFTMEKQAKLLFSIQDYAAAVGGLPRSAADVLQKRGWMLPYLLAYDDLLWGRWSYWLDILQRETVEGSGPIPQIEWADLGSIGVSETRRMLSDCLDHHESNIDLFADWLLWALAATHERPRVSEKLNEHYYRKFDLFLILDRPTDYLSQVLCDESGRGYKGALGYYPTPFQITKLMADIIVGKDREGMKLKTVCDPCVGCGALLLPMSNFCLRGYSQDISGIAVRLCKIQLCWYAPWFTQPGRGIAGLDRPASQSA